MSKLISLIKAPYIYLLPLVYIIFLFQWAVVHPYGNFNVTYYDELADAFLAGQVHLLRPPPPELLALPDPWDPNANRGFREAPDIPGQRFQGIHDLTLYDGKLYVQWGPLPALVIIPLRWVAGHDLPMGRLVLVVAVLAALAYAAATLKLARLSGLPQAQFMNCLIVPLFMLCPFWTFILRRIAVYETAVFFGQFCVSFALLSVVVAFDEKLTRGRDRVWLLALGSMFLGLSVDCRPELAPLGLMVPVLLYVWSRTNPHGRSWHRLIGPALALGVPAATLLACTLVYNEVRFGNFLETGPNWILWAGHESILQHKFKLLSAGRILPNIWYYFLAPVQIFPPYPFGLEPTLLSPHSWMSADGVDEYYDYVEKTSGLFVVVPMTMMVLLSPLLILRKSRTGADDRVGLIVGLLLLGGLLCATLFLSIATIRYGSEWCMWWLMAGAIIAFLLREKLRGLSLPVASVLFDVGLVASTLWSCWVGVAFLLGGG